MSVKWNDKTVLAHKVRSFDTKVFDAKAKDPDGNDLTFTFEVDKATSSPNVDPKEISFQRDVANTGPSGWVANTISIKDVAIGDVVGVKVTVSDGVTFVNALMIFTVESMNYAPELALIESPPPGPLPSPGGFAFLAGLSDPDGIPNYRWSWQVRRVSGSFYPGGFKYKVLFSSTPGLVVQFGAVKSPVRFEVHLKVVDGTHEVFLPPLSGNPFQVDVQVSEPEPQPEPEPEPPDPEPEPEPVGDKKIHCADGELRISYQNFERAKSAGDVDRVINQVTFAVTWHSTMSKAVFREKYPVRPQPPPHPTQRQMCMALHLEDPPYRVTNWHLDRAKALGVTWVNLWARGVGSQWWQHVAQGVIDRGMRLVVKLDISGVSVLKEVIAKTPACQHWMIGNEPRLQGQRWPEFIVKACKELSQWENRPEVLIGPAWAGRGSEVFRQKCLDLGLRDWVDYESVNLYADDWLMNDPKVWPSEFNAPANLDAWLSEADNSEWPVIPFFIQNWERGSEQHNLYLYDEKLKPTAMEKIYRDHYGIPDLDEEPDQEPVPLPDLEALIKKYSDAQMLALSRKLGSTVYEWYEKELSA